MTEPWVDDVVVQIETDWAKREREWHRQRQVEYELAEIAAGRHKCPHCLRYFKANRIDYHMTLCEAEIRDHWAQGS